MSLNYSYLSNSDGKFIESLYQQWKNDPESVDFGWQKFFEGFELGRGTSVSQPKPEIDLVPSETILKNIQVLNLISMYRRRGHFFTNTNPVRKRRTYSPNLDLVNFGLSDSDLPTVFEAGNEIGLGPATLQDILDLLNQTYCQSIGVEFMYNRSVEEVDWLGERMESGRNKPVFSIGLKKHILKKLNQAVAFENFLGSKYVGAKRFSLEGAETLIPALDAIIEMGTDLGMEEFIIGMAHRGRLNVLANIIGKTYDDVFSEFEGNIDEAEGFDGDVKYHQGYSSDVITEKGDLAHVSLMPNPSHLEAVGSVVQGVVRAKIDKKYGGDSGKITAILIHGDAAIAGQGVVYETLQMSELPAYQTGGTIHVVINNQVGFTTDYLDARSSTYCTDVAKVTQSPVFHVNGDDVEAVVYAIGLATEFRQKFHKDVFIDLLCYRRHGHNEADEPRFTQPELYRIIEKHPNPQEIYIQKLIELGSIEARLAKEMELEFRRLLQARLDDVKEKKKAIHYSLENSGWKNLRGPMPGDFDVSPETGVPELKLRPLAEKMAILPDGKHFYKKTERIFKAREKMLNETDRLDWAMGELMGYASLLAENQDVRISGQDVQRGTFAHRHAVLRFEDTLEEYTPLQNLKEKQGSFEIYNSLLSEYAVLGFEYGYSWSAPQSLVIWEAQFGDFVNGAQIIIDQFISSGNSKWKRISGLVMLLPHGFEGQGPEHSSARMERFLELCAGNNMQVVNPTTPAQMFHLLRRQMVRPVRVPLVVFTPKSLLRHPEATSPFNDFTKGRFWEIIDDPNISQQGKVRKVLLCSGKIYYDLLEQQTKGRHKDIAIVRIEQMYPFPENQLEGIVARYKNATSWVWVQEEPLNMGPWAYLLRIFHSLPVNLELISRKENSTPATGFKSQHESQQQYLINKAFDIIPESKPDKKRSSKIVTTK